MAKIHVTFNVESEVKKDFNLACIEHELNMSETVENMMKNFSSASKKMIEEKRLAKEQVKSSRIEIVDETRLEEDLSK